MMVKEDGAEKTKQIAAGMVVLSIAVWLLWQFWFGNGLFEGKALVKGTYGSGATEMFQLVFFLIGQLGAISLGLFRGGTSLLKYIGTFLFGSTEQKEQNSFPKLNINVNNNPTQPSLSKLKIENITRSDSPLFRTNDQGLLYRDVQLEKQLMGPATPDELASDAVDALMAGDKDRLDQRFSQLFPEKSNSTVVEVKADESSSTKA